MQTEDRELDQVLDMPLRSRSLLLGATGTGKSTLSETLMKHFLVKHTQTRCLVIDSKPRFRAQWELNGIATEVSKRYKKWDMGAYLPGSYVLPLSGDYGKELDQVWRLGGKIAIAQGGRDHWQDLMEVAKVFYERYGAKRPRLLYVNEQADFFEIQRLGGIFQQTARSGRELNIAYLAESQRPRGIPKTLLTEMQRLYMFELRYSEDLKHVKEMGIPEDTLQPTVEHSFFFWDVKLKKQSPSNHYYIL